MKESVKVMNIKSRIPKNFYKIFNSKYLEYYQLVLMKLYEESGQVYSLLGLTEEECRDIIEEKIARFTLDWSQEELEDEGELLTRANMASIMLKRLEEWGWLRKDYDEEINEYVISFPDYSQMYVEVFIQLYSEDTSKERESILSLYSHLYTYSFDKDKNNDILKTALQTSKNLLQMLINMQEGIREYFDALSDKKTFIGIQEVLINEINNSDSKKYAILTTTDSFYRYKEEVKELINKNLLSNEEAKQNYIEKRVELKQETMSWYRNERGIKFCEEALEILFKINREFDAIERRYNMLIDQKRIFAKRAAARIRYILVENVSEEDVIKTFIRFLDNSQHKEEIIDALGRSMHLTEKPHVVQERSFLRPKEITKQNFEPKPIVQSEQNSYSLEDYIVKPLYTRAAIKKFRRKNEVNGVFLATKETVKNISDLEKLFFVWQEATEVLDESLEIEIGDEIETEAGFKYSSFSIRRK